MIVCICNNVSDRKIRQAVDAGMTSMVELRDHLDIGTCCGKCHPSAKRVLRDCLAENAPSPLHAAHQPHPAHVQAQPILFYPNTLAA
ncbi:(2Fe-2S)-binding protein [Noviherbaspirillum suwonense]|uniref:Bacterioferritin-associated ferredoxin n=1 Tax=Noviherbaspirillum suwonense TaxID=1224511 RepID=A0ABY1QD07_9BURK|nr:(2Fe-2S)-binding protein [Noviherbaspirillum suwonense]SMP67691.1 bacterioferritin-associated ferredoxin [Noviherbaspirillum suwonense]